MKMQRKKPKQTGHLQYLHNVYIISYTRMLFIYLQLRTDLHLEYNSQQRHSNVITLQVDFII